MNRRAASLAICLSFAMALPAQAQAVRVTSGEHDGFTRLVVQLAGAETWSFGRRADGYELHLATPHSFDLSQVYRLIGRTRLAGIWVNPASGALRLAVGCACHAVPFEHRAGIVVIDLRDGPPTTGDTFEQGIDGTAMPPLTGLPGLRPRPRPARAPIAPPDYDWLALAQRKPPALMLPLMAAQSTALTPPQVAGVKPAVQPLREALLMQLSRSAADGVVEMRVPARQDIGSAPDLGLAQIHIEGEPGHLYAPPDTPLSAEGAACPADERLVVQDWMTTAPVAGQFAAARNGLVGEFDRPDPQAVTRAARFLLALGFGAELRSLIDALGTEDLPDARLWRSMSYILDGDRDPDPAFVGFGACQNAAALWSLLSEPPPPQAAPVASGAALQAFSALPPHLRRLLGPRVVQSFLARGDREAAENAHASVDRTSAGDGSATRLIGAEIALAQGDAAGAGKAVLDLAGTPGPDRAEALATLVEARAAERIPVGADTVSAIEALLADRQDDARSVRLRRAMVLARAASGDFAGAFAALPAAPEAAPRVWDLLANAGSDDALLAQTVGQAPPAAALPVAGKIAARLTDLGLGKAAQPWIAAMVPPDPEIAARAFLAEKDARAALRALAGASSASAEALRAQAFQMLGDDRAAAGAWSQTGQAAPRLDALIRAQDWPAVAQAGDTGWTAATTALIGISGTGAEGAPKPSPVSGNGSALRGPLGRARDLADHGAADRATLEQLLQSPASGSGG